MINNRINKFTEDHCYSVKHLIKRLEKILFEFQCKSRSCHPDHSVPCDWDDFNTPDYNDNVLTGALVGGPNQTDYWEDNRADYVMNEVSCDYNAGFQTALAGIYKY